MMSSKVDTEVQWLNSIVIPEMLKNGKLIKNYDADNVAANSTFRVRDIQIRFIGADEAFMLTTCYRATVEFEFGNDVHKCNLVVKKAPEVPQEVFDSINFATLYNNEIEAYTLIIPAIEKFTGKQLNVPNYFFSDLQQNQAKAAIVLEDFGKDNWRISKDKFNLSLEHVLLAVKYLANFHGSGFALKQMNSPLFTTITSSLKESRYATPSLHPDWDLTLKQSVKRIIVSTHKYQSDVEETFLKRLEHLISDYYRYGKQLVTPVEPFVTLCHGDYLRNNVAYKYDQHTDTPIDIMMFDLQTLRVSSPMVDLTVFLALSTFAEVRCTHFELIFSTYCKELSATYELLTKDSLPPFLSHDSLLKEYIRFLPYSLGIAASFLMTLVEPDAASSEDMLLAVRTQEEIIKDTMTRGGEVTDRELAHQTKELYDLSVQHKVDVCEGFDF